MIGITWQWKEETYLYNNIDIVAVLTHHFFDVPLSAIHKTDDVICIEAAASNTRVNGKA